MFGLTTTRRLRDAQAEAARQRRRADDAESNTQTAVFNREQVLRQLALADAANRRLEGRNRELGRRVAALSESDPDYAAALERRVARLGKVGRRVLAAWAREQRRADGLQARLDDAVGLSPRGIKDSAAWQPAFQRPKGDGS